jgi:hypothetical protein
MAETDKAWRIYESYGGVIDESTYLAEYPTEEAATAQAAQWNTQENPIASRWLRFVVRPAA